jgi:hypothetical protein
MPDSADDTTQPPTPQPWCVHGVNENAPCGDCTTDRYGENNPFNGPDFSLLERRLDHIKKLRNGETVILTWDP